MEEFSNHTYPKKMLMTADTVGGVWTYSLELARYLGTLGIEVHLATMGALPDEKQLKQVATIRNLVLHPSAFKLEWMEDPWEDVDRAGDWLLQLRDQVKPDLVHLNNFCHGNLNWGVPVLMVAHSCVFSWWESVIGGTPPDTYQEYFRRVQMGLRAADLVAAPSRDMLTSISRIYGNLENKAIIPNGCETIPQNPQAKEDFIFSMGRLWDTAKNIEALNRVAAELSWPVVIAGDKEVPGTSGNTTFGHVNHLGKLNGTEVQEVLSRASIYALPARYEPFGLSILEAANSGCTLVLGDIPSLRENWIGAAFFVEPGNQEALHYTLTTLINRPELREKYAEKAAIRAQAFTLDRMGKLYLAGYNQLLTKEKASTQKMDGIA
ncbi:glycosyltransferase family 4 protein [Telluribacter sp.]|jgi:glycosyltransferase involved in cell wall biosynthesis|uniref:glycosyltransferase family 4 protein n=1 Tax=Telluribacter sp. TaxID=1978767 RepID=UPI002E0D6236|nr:glycosyltransferase family 4 protein [Telluribacter sp.]